MTTLAILRALLSNLDRTTIDVPADRDRRDFGGKRHTAAAFRVDGWYNFELEATHRAFRR